ncbi:MAG: hypothetical protein LBT84_03220 [Spirochaetia bacterium]|jgi:hypothetical protein|nr:hypothetical protein [Spirochaetia bacterium]
MRKIIYKLFFLVGLFVPIVGLTGTGNAIENDEHNSSSVVQSSAASEKLYFSDAAKNNAGDLLIAEHYSHSSHSSHSSHRSHVSHYSSR